MVMKKAVFALSSIQIRNGWGQCVPTHSLMSSREAVEKTTIDVVMALNCQRLPLLH
jgi:hypothetical protein